jgi:methyl-accepting chemotaxis protein
VRRLAENTGNSINDIDVSVTSIVRGIEASASLSTQAGAGLAAIMTYSQSNADIVNQLNSAMAEQDRGTSEILEATHELLKITEQVKGAIGQQKSAIVDFDKSLRLLEESTRI